MTAPASELRSLQLLIPNPRDAARALELLDREAALWAGVLRAVLAEPDPIKRNQIAAPVLGRMEAST